MPTNEEIELARQKIDAARAALQPLHDAYAQLDGASVLLAAGSQPPPPPPPVPPPEPPETDLPWYDSAVTFEEYEQGWTSDGGKTFLEDAGGSVRIDAEGKVIEGLYIRGGVKVLASNGVIRNCRIDGGGNTLYICNTDNLEYTGTTFENCEIVGSSSAAFLGGFMTVRNCHIHHHGSDAFKLRRYSLIEGCFVHHLGMTPNSHADGEQHRGGGADVVFRKCSFEMPVNLPGFNSNAAFIVHAYLGPIADLLVEGCYLNGGNYTIYSDHSDQGHQVSNFIVKDCRFGRDFRYGPVSGRDGLTISGCVWHDTGALCEFND